MCVDNGTEIDVWQYHELQEAVQDFQSRYYLNEEGYLVPKVQELNNNFYFGGAGNVSPSQVEESELGLFGQIQQMDQAEEQKVTRETL